MSDKGFDTHEIENVQTAKLINLMEQFIAARKLRKVSGTSMSRESGILTVSPSRYAGGGRTAPLARASADEELTRKKERDEKAKERRMAAGSPR